MRLFFIVAVLDIIIGLFTLYFVSHTKHSFLSLVFKRLKIRLGLTEENQEVNESVEFEEYDAAELVQAMKLRDAPKSTNFSKESVMTGFELQEYEMQELRDLENDVDNQFTHLSFNFNNLNPNFNPDNKSMGDRISRKSSKSEARSKRSRMLEALMKNGRRDELVILALNFRSTVITISFITYALSCFVVTAVYEFREDIKSRDDDIFALDFFLSLAVASLLFSIAMVIELYYSAVPEVRLYGKLFRISSIVVDNPHLLHRINVVIMASAILFSLLFGMILPAFVPEERELWDLSLYIVIGLTTAICTITMIGVLLILRRVFAISIMSATIQIKGIMGRVETLKIRIKALEKGSSENEGDNNKTINLFEFKVFSNKRASVLTPEQRGKVSAELSETVDKLKGFEKKTRYARATIRITRKFVNYALVVASTSLLPTSIFAISFIFVEVLQENMYIFFAIQAILGLLGGGGILLLVSCGFYMSEDRNPLICRMKLW